VNGADAVTFSHSTSSFPLAPPAPDSVILRVSTGADGLPMVCEARPSSVAGSSVVAPSRMPSGKYPNAPDVAGAGHQGFVDDQLPLAVVEVGVQGVVALGNGEAIHVEVGVSVQHPAQGFGSIANTIIDG
jgi:hypothetical protein